MDSDLPSSLGIVMLMYYSYALCECLIARLRSHTHSFRLLKTNMHGILKYQKIMIEHHHESCLEYLCKMVLVAYGLHVCG